jgi:uncharacterized protein with GYD domain
LKTDEVDTKVIVVWKLGGEGARNLKVEVERVAPARRHLEASGFRV